MKWCEIFRTGKHTDSMGKTKEWTKSDLETICSNFETKNPDVPICVGHPKTNSPAYGWIDKLRIEGEKLYASFKDVQPEFQEAVKKGLYKTRSISLTKDLIPRHIAFLGGQAPAIKGMEQFCFQTDINEENDIIIDFNEGEEMTEELKEQLAAKDAELEATKKELQEVRQEALKKEFEDFCDAAISEGNILPAQRDNVLNLLFANTDTSINFDDGSSKSSNEVFKEFVKSLHQMDFQEVGNENNLTEEKEIDFSDAEDVQVHIKAIQKEYEDKGMELNPAQALQKLKTQQGGK